jgi:hypothetical protein
MTAPAPSWLTHRAMPPEPHWWGGREADAQFFGDHVFGRAAAMTPLPRRKGETEPPLRSRATSRRQTACSYAARSRAAGCQLELCAPFCPAGFGACFGVGRVGRVSAVRYLRSVGVVVSAAAVAGVEQAVEAEAGQSGGDEQ